jgi:type I restriction enzyme S subunit
VSEAPKIVLPRGWELAEFRDLFEGLQYGFTASAIEDPSAPRLLRITDIQNSSVNWTTVPGCAIEDAVRPRYLLADGDFVFARTGSIEKAWRVRNPPPAVFASYLIRGRLRDPRLSDWMRHFIESSDYVGQAFKASAGIGRPNVNAQNLGRFQIRISPIPEQRRIIAILESLFPKLDAAVAALERVRTNLKRYRASVLNAAVEGRLVPTEAELARKEERNFEPASVLLDQILTERRRRWEESELTRMKAAGKLPKDDRWKSKYREPVAPNTSALPQLPDGWCWASADQCTNQITDGEHITPSRTDDGVFLLSARNVQDGRLSLEVVDYVSESVFEQLSKRLTMEPGDVLLSCSGSVGRSCVVPGVIRFALVRSVAVLKPVLPMGTYLSLALRSLFLQGQINRKKTQTAQANIFQGKIRTLVFPLPPRDEQCRIVSEIERLLSVVDQTDHSVNAAARRSDRLRQSILKCAFEGKLVDQDPNDEPASVLLERIRAERAAATPSRKSRELHTHEVEAAK